MIARAALVAIVVLAGCGDRVGKVAPDLLVDPTVTDLAVPMADALTDAAAAADDLADASAVAADLADASASAVDDLAPGCAFVCSGATPLCDPAQHVCVACLAEGDCTEAAICSAGACVAGCSPTHGCGDAGVCEVDAGWCNPCGSGGLCPVDGGLCVDNRYDDGNCGACGLACGGGAQCWSGKCCPLGTVNCGGACVDISSDPSNCGACGASCALNCNGGCCTATPCVRLATPQYGHAPASLQAGVVVLVVDVSNAPLRCQVPGCTLGVEAHAAADCSDAASDPGCGGTGCQQALLADGSNNGVASFSATMASGANGYLCPFLLVPSVGVFRGPSQPYVVQ